MLFGLFALTVALPAQEPLRGEARVTSAPENTQRTFELRSTAPLRDRPPGESVVTFTEAPGQRAIRTGNVMFDALYALAVHEARLNSVASITDWAYGKNAPLALDVFQTGEKWTYVWTRDLAYSVDLGLASLDPQRAVTSLLFKSSGPKQGVRGGFPSQIVQDTGSGGSYPISTDRVAWALGADAALRWLPEKERAAFFPQAYAILRDSLEQDRRLIFDESDGLYRGEQSFLDWREQTYPEWTREHTLPIGLSKALSTNVLHYLALRRAADWANRAGDAGAAQRYGDWADALSVAINQRFWDNAAGLYSTYLLSEGGAPVRARRYDLLGSSLAISAGVASTEQARAILRTYPTGPHGPAVVWPQERDVAIYHNQAIWPFVTAYWVRAGRHAGQANVVERGTASLFRLAAENLSHMENYDFATGLAHYQGLGNQGPVINSARQLWSVGAYLSLVQEVFFGLEASWEGVRFRPFITPAMQAAYFPGRAAIELSDLDYRGTRHHVKILLPKTPAPVGSAYLIASTKLNGREFTGRYAASKDLQPVNLWEIQLGVASAPSLAVPLAAVDPVEQLYAPPAPVWDDAHGAVKIENGKLALHFKTDEKSLPMTIYRNGQRVATHVTGPKWIDPNSGDFRARVFDYVAEAVDPQTGYSSQLTPMRRHLVPEQLLTLPLAQLEIRGGQRSADALLDWGASGDKIESQTFTVPQSGRYALLVRYANGSGPINTGITCAVKRLEVLRAPLGDFVAGGYAVMPQLATWERWEDSSPVVVRLEAGVRYALRLREDDYSRNMSYLAHNERYTAWPGGGEKPYNLVRIAALKVLRLE